MKPEDFIMMPIPANAYVSVCALLGGASVLAGPGNQAAPIGVAPSGADEQPGLSAGAAASQAADDGRGLTSVATDDSINAGEIDAHGHPWSPDLHASTKGKTKDGLWRMKVGVSRPDPLPGFPKDSGATGGDIGTSTETPTPSATSQDAAVSANVPSATAGAEEEDEFAAFRNAAAASEANEQAAAAAVPARQYSDADLGALCNQAAVKLGDPSPIKEIIAAYTPEGQVAHSRNIPAEKRAEFVKAVEGKAGIEFAG